MNNVDTIIIEIELYLICNVVRVFVLYDSTVKYTYLIIVAFTVS